jgi:hypothetical protein
MRSRMSCALGPNRLGGCYTDVPSSEYRFIHNCTATRALLACLLRIYRNRYFIKYFGKVFNRDTKLIPRCVINRLSQARIFHHIFNPQIDRISQVVGRSLRTVQVLLHNAIRLPTYFEVASFDNLSSESPCSLNL